jgi:hypothetical protein
MDDEELRQIEANVRLAIEQLGPLGDVDFGLNSESVQWVEGFIERQRARDDFDVANVGGLVGVLGSFLGACVIAGTGARWHRGDDQRLGVLFPNGSIAFPFAKVEKQFGEGLAGGDSISSFYRIAVDFVATGKLAETDAKLAPPAVS